MAFGKGLSSHAACLSVCLSFYPACVCLSVCPACVCHFFSVRLSRYLSFCLFVCHFVCVCLYVLLSMFVCPSVCLSCLSAVLSVCQSFCLSNCQFLENKYFEQAAYFKYHFPFYQFPFLYAIFLSSLPKNKNILSIIKNFNSSTNFTVYLFFLLL